MDDRQREIRESAGLAESRLNQEFIDWLRKWSSPILMVIAVGFGGYYFYGRYQASQIDKTNRAFTELDLVASTPNPSPDSLKSVAEEFAGVAGVPMIARLEAADAYLRALRQGIKLGATLAQDGSLASPDDALSDEDRTRYLAEAETLYQRVVAEAGDSRDRALLALQGMFGLAAVAESRGDFDAAKTRYEAIAPVAQRAGFTALAKIAADRVASLTALSTLPKVYTEAELPKPPAPPAPPAAETPPAPAAPAADAPADQPADQPAPTPPPAEQPAPAPDAPKPPGR